MTGTASNYYVDKQQLYESLCDWKEQCDLAEANNLPKPQLPNYVGQVIIDICEGTARRANFRNYTWKEEMIGDGIIAAVKAMNKFDPYRLGKDGKVNPFGFIGLCVTRAFINRITKEKDQHARKVKAMLDPSTDSFSTLDGDEGDYSELNDKSDLSDFYYGSKVY